MAEKQTKIEMFEAEYVCDKCGEGVMRPTGFMFDSNPPQWPHKCTSCGAEMTFGETYPSVKYRRVED